MTAGRGRKETADKGSSFCGEEGQDAGPEEVQVIKTVEKKLRKTRGKVKLHLNLDGFGPAAQFPGARGGFILYLCPVKLKQVIYHCS